MVTLPRSSSALDIAMNGSHHFGVLWGVLLAYGKFLEWCLKQWQLSRRPLSFIAYCVMCLEILTNIWRIVDAFSLFFRFCKLYYPLREWLKKCVRSYTMAWFQHLSPWNHWYKSESHLGSRTVYHQKILWKILDLFFFLHQKSQGQTHHDERVFLGSLFAKGLHWFSHASCTCFWLTPVLLLLKLALLCHPV